MSQFTRSPRILHPEPSRVGNFLNRSALSYIGLGLIGLHLSLIWKFTGNTDQLLLSAIFWAAIVMLLRQQRSPAWQRTNALALGVGSGLLLLGLSKAIFLNANESEFVRFFPGLMSLGLALVASGWRIWQYRRIGALIAILMLPPGVVEHIIDWLVGLSIQKIIAQSSAFILHYCGIGALRNGTAIYLRTGAVTVEYACTGIPILLLLIQLSGLMGIAFRIRRSQQLLLILIAIVLAWLLATIRVAIMALVVAQPQSFEYWHGSAGGQIFSTAAIITFALICQQFPAVKQAIS